MKTEEMTKEDIQQEATPEVARTSEGVSDDGRKKNRRKSSRPTGRKERAPQEFHQKIIDIRRVTRVVSGGRRFSFSVSIVIGDHKGRVGVGIGKSGDTSMAISKAERDARKHLIIIPRTESGSIAYPVEAKLKASVVEIKPAPGRGLVAGSSVRDVLELAGITDINAKLLSRSKNKLNNARVAIMALKKLKSVK